MQGDCRVHPERYDAPTRAPTPHPALPPTHPTSSPALGPFRKLCRLNVAGRPSRVVDVSAQVVDQRLALILPGGGVAGTASSLDFGTLMHGEEKTITATLTNNGPQPLPYFISTHVDRQTTDEMARELAALTAVAQAGGNGDDDAAAPPPQSDATPADWEVDDGAVTVVPAEGNINPYASMTISFTFKPPTPELRKGFHATGAGASQRHSRPYALDAKVSAPDINANLSLKVLARVTKPSIEISETELHFGECPVNTRRDVLVTLTNTGHVAVPYVKRRRCCCCCCSYSYYCYHYH